jgi:DNA-binding transcriptional ArsR family regulator
MQGAIHSARVRELAPTARLVYLALQGGASRTAEELLERTGADDATLTRALRTLRDEGIVETDTHPVDGRRRQYTLADNNPHTSREYAAVNSGSHPSEQPESAGQVKSTPQEGEHGR